jgi:hypothetical protein
VSDDSHEAVDLQDTAPLPARNWLHGESLITHHHTNQTETCFLAKGADVLALSPDAALEVAVPFAVGSPLPN